MDLIAHRLYRNKEVFLQELISNASDALEKLQHLSVTAPWMMHDVTDLDIRIETDKDNGLITITDLGIGMTRQELVYCLGTISHKGTSNLLKDCKDGLANNLICQSGLGFYSAFLVSDRVVVSTKSPKSDKQYVWEGDADASSYTIREETNPEKLLPRGTRLTLHLKSEDKVFAHPEQIQRLVKNFSQLIRFPIYTWTEKEVEVEGDSAEAETVGEDGIMEPVVKRYQDWELTIAAKPAWPSNPKELTGVNLKEFYKKTFNDSFNPLQTCRITHKDPVEFWAVLYIPSNKDVTNNPNTKNTRFYVNNVLVSNDFDKELLPSYLSFFRGVVHTNDLLPNAPRHQMRRTVRIIRRFLVKSAYGMMCTFSLKELSEDFDIFWENFGMDLKWACINYPIRHYIAPFLRFFSSHSADRMINLHEYLAYMKPDQEHIYYIGADSLTSASNTPCVERLIEQDIEVLFLVNPNDEAAVSSLKQYWNKKFVNLGKEIVDLGVKNDMEKAVEEEFALMCDWMKKQLGDKVKFVAVSNRLSTSPCVLVSHKFSSSANTERLGKAPFLSHEGIAEDILEGRMEKVLVINPRHTIIKNMKAAFKCSSDHQEALRIVELLYDAALISSGFKHENPVELGAKIYNLMDVVLSCKKDDSFQGYHQMPSF